VVGGEQRFRNRESLKKNFSTREEKCPDSIKGGGSEATERKILFRGDKRGGVLKLKKG